MDSGGMAKSAEGPVKGLRAGQCFRIFWRPCAVEGGDPWRKPFCQGGKVASRGDGDNVGDFRGLILV